MTDTASTILPFMTHTQVLPVVRARAYSASGKARRIRTASGLSLREIAELVEGVTPSGVHYWETGRRVPRGEAAARYGRLLADLEAMVADLA